jgi:hypothetical protein
VKDRCNVCVCVCVGSSSDDRAGCSFLCTREVVQGEEIWPVAKPGGVSVNPVTFHAKIIVLILIINPSLVCLYHILYA